MRKFFAALLAASTLAIATTASAGETLTDPEVVKKILEGKNFNAYNPTNGVATDGTFFSGGRLYGKATNGQDSEGTWEVDPDGSVCTRWRNYNWMSGCVPIETTSTPNVYVRNIQGKAVRLTIKPE